MGIMTGQVGRPGGRSAVFHGEQVPAVGNTLEGVAAPVREADARAQHERLHGTGDQDLGLRPAEPLQAAPDPRVVVVQQEPPPPVTQPASRVRCATMSGNRRPAELCT